MGVQVCWDNDERDIIRYSLEGDWKWQDMVEAVTASNHMLDEVGHKVDFIFDTSDSAGIPGGALSHLRRFVGHEHPLTGESVIVGAQRSTLILLAQGLFNIVQTLYKKDWGFQFADTLEEARGLLRAPTTTDST